MREFRAGIACLAVLATMGVFVSAGCNSAPDKPESIASEARVQEIVEMRKIFDKAGGNWDSLTEADKAEYIRLAGDEAQAKTMWTTMSTPMGSEPNTGAAPNIPMGGAQPSPAGGG